MRCVPSGDLELAVHEWPGDEPAVLFAHATGFCAGTWRAIAAPLAAETGRRTVAWDHRGHGDSSKPPGREAYDWDLFTGDCLAVLDALGLDQVDAVGHSIGGATIATAAARAPERFRRLVLIEPIIFPPGFAPGGGRGNSLAEGALRRRNVFPSESEMRDRLGAKPPFSLWRPDVFDDYVASATEDVDGTGGERRLKCPGSIEALVFEQTPSSRAWDILPELKTPALVISGESTETFGADHWRDVAERIPEHDYVELAGYGHLVPMENPDLVSSHIARFLAAGA